MSLDLCHGFVLHRRAYRETSFIVEVFTDHSGRTSVLAKGARRSKSQQQGLLQPFKALLLAWSPRGELPVLTQVEGDGYSSPLQGNALLSGFYLNELLVRLLHRHDPHPELFHAYVQALALLRKQAGEPIAREATLRVFEKRLLDALGYAMVLEREVEQGGPVAPQCAYRYEIERGPCLCDGGTGAISGRTLMALAREQFDSPVELKEAKGLMRTVLAHYLGERPLHTRSLFRSSHPQAPS